MTTYTVGQTLSLSVKYFDSSSVEVVPILTTGWTCSSTASATIGSTGLESATSLLLRVASNVVITATDPTSGFAKTVTFNIIAQPVSSTIRSGRINILNPNVFVGQGSPVTVQFFDGFPDEQGNPTGNPVTSPATVVWSAITPDPDPAVIIGSTGLQSGFATGLQAGTTVITATEPVSGFVVYASFNVQAYPNNSLSPFSYVDNYIQNERQQNPLWVTQTYLCNWSTE